MNIFNLIITCLLLNSCSTNMKKQIGIVVAGPDEYQVQSHKVLEFPKNNSLPLPKSRVENKLTPKKYPHRSKK